MTSPITYRDFPETVALRTPAVDQAKQKHPAIAEKSPRLKDNFLAVHYNLTIFPQKGAPREVGYIQFAIPTLESALCISALYNTTIDTKAPLKGVGSAGLELALRVSVIIGAKGKIILFAGSGSAFFYYQWGLRFEKPIQCMDANLTAIFERTLKIPAPKTATVNLDKVIARMLADKKTPREGITSPGNFLAFMTLPDRVIQYKMTEFGIPQNPQP